jgi:hypothetical protein
MVRFAMIQRPVRALGGPNSTPRRAIRGVMFLRRNARRQRE